MVGNLNNANLNCDWVILKIRSGMVETKAIYISKVRNHINVNMDRYEEGFFSVEDKVLTYIH